MLLVRMPARTLRWEEIIMQTQDVKNWASLSVFVSGQRRIGDGGSGDGAFGRTPAHANGALCVVGGAGGEVQDRHRSCLNGVIAGT